MIDASMYEAYASTIQSFSVRLLLTVAAKEGLKILTGDIGNAFPDAPTKEKIFTRAGPEFGEKEGAIIIIKSALYGLVTSAHQWNRHFGDTIISTFRIGNVPQIRISSRWSKPNGS